MGTVHGEHRNAQLNYGGKIGPTAVATMELLESRLSQTSPALQPTLAQLRDSMRKKFVPLAPSAAVTVQSHAEE